MAERREKYMGAYIAPPNILAPLAGQANDARLQKQLWELSEKVVAEIDERGGIEEELIERLGAGRQEASWTE